MPFQKVQPEKLSASVVKQIEQLILRGILSPGERLPAERELAERLGVSRPSLRDAIGELQARGLLASKAYPACLWPTFWAPPSRKPDPALRHP